MRKIDKLLGFLRKSRAVTFFAIVLTVLAANWTVYSFTPLYDKTSSEEIISRVNDYLKENGIVQYLQAEDVATLLSDSKYDSTTLLAELKGTDAQELTSYFRPLELGIGDSSGKTAYLTVATGWLRGKYVLTAPALYNAIVKYILAATTAEDPEFAAELARAMETGQVFPVARLRADANQDDPWKFEDLTLHYFGASVLVFKRPSSSVFPITEEFPFRIVDFAEINQKGLQNAAYGVGVSAFQDTALTRIYTGTVSYVNTENGLAVVETATALNDLGGAVFLLRDGEFELLGFAVENGNTYIIAKSFNDILDEMRGFGIDLGQ